VAKRQEGWEWDGQWIVPSLLLCYGVNWNRMLASEQIRGYFIQYTPYPPRGTKLT